MKPFWRFVLAGVCAWSACASAQQTVLLKVRGIDNPELYNNVRIHLSQLSNDEADGSERYQYLVSQTIENALRALGYFDNTIRYTFVPRAGLKDLLYADVTLAKPVKLGENEVSIIGEAAQNPAFIDLKKTIPPAGTILNQGTYDDFKSALQTLAVKQGYFDADFQISQLLVMLQEHLAIWHMIFDSGERYHYGEVTFEHSQIREDYLRNMLNIKSGDPYLINDLSTLTANYTSTNWFSSVLLQPKLVAEDHRVDLNVLLRPKKKNSMEIGIGYASDVGPRLQLNWNKPWINSRGHSFRSSFYLSKPQQTVEMTYKIPLLKNALKYYYEYSAGLDRERTNDTHSDTITLAGLRYWKHDSGWQYFLGLRARYDAFTQADVSNRTLLIYPTAGLNRTRLRGGMFPSWGDAQNITFNLGQKIWGSDVNFFSVRASSAWIRTYFDNHRILLRFDAGYMKSADFNRIPPALRYFAGGDRSIRGYGYKKISPKDKNGKLVGASRLATANFEYQYQVYPNWWGAIFYDTGLAANSYSRKELRSGAGVGVRWASPVGAVKLDIATPVHDKDGSHNIQFYIGLGTEL
ncbi:autotransporter assembly complex protein TamA [Spirabiliibacterium pneumoniae]|uniref:autotransporter assembly complex protein TamA n=1 Tax=Spirabiliibacterium pneumoniae TaxID=221400 RepID=UPI002E27E106|nr:autotransporter assembly complex family protein [Spirabiliibacterium pneumoniae]